MNSPHTNHQQQAADASTTSGGRLVILGAAESGVGAALLGKAKGWEVFVSDGGSIKPSYKSILEEAGISFEEARHSVERILNADCIVKSPGIPETAEIMKKIRAKGIRVESEIEFGFRYKGDSKIIAITGSNGKSTTTKLCYHLLKDAGYDVSMVGNIGTSLARQIFEQPTAWYVMEISSFQLDDTHRFRPFIAVLLNITPDHLDRYNHDFKNYVASKFLIAKNQTEEDHFIVNTDDPVITDYLTKHFFTVPTTQITMQDKIDTAYGAFLKEENIHFRYLGEDNQVSIHDLTIPGKHNQYNTMAAGISGQIAGIRKEKLRASFSTFEGLDHRLERVASVRGVQFVNDSKATNVNSVWFALESMKTPTVLILGGQDKGNDYSELSELVREKVKAIVCLGVNNEAIHAAFSSDVKIIKDVLSAEEAVHIAFKLSEPGDTVLLSPACASFDLFKNYEDRGDQFKAAVKAL